MPRSAGRFDVFCRVVDNFGDAGVALRLSRQLAAEHGADVTLWIDDAGVLSSLLGGIAVDDGDRHGGVRVRTLLAMRDDVEAAGVVVEMFGCGLPDRYLDAMERRARPPVWIVLEYLSAEAWVDGAHALPSPHPTRALRRWFAFPGFTPASAGLLRERDLLERRRHAEGDACTRPGPWTSLGFPAPDDDALVVSLFCYPNAALPALLDTWSLETCPVACIVPDGVAPSEIACFVGKPVRCGDLVSRNGLTVAVAPFVHQHAFDRRLWGSDLCVVRGEDSFVRAQWAARPFAWNIYPQPDRAHAAKLAAFDERYTRGLDARTGRAWREFSMAFNEEAAAQVVNAWPGFRDALPSLRALAGKWAVELALQTDLASRLVALVRERL
jgi:uncharacterized repeat protein (TIGR03837 family)